MTLLLALVLACGTARWEIKTLTDKDANAIDWTPQDTTIEALRAKKAPRYSDAAPRWPEEKRTYRISATVLRWHGERDGDLHVVVADAHGRTIIVELPAPVCVARSNRAAELIAARSSYLSGAKTVGRRRAVIEGVLFFDKVHGQDGVAPSGVELHPVLKFTWL